MFSRNLFCIRCKCAYIKRLLMHMSMRIITMRIDIMHTASYDGRRNDHAIKTTGDGENHPC